MVECSAILHVGELTLEYLAEYDDIRVINFEFCGENAVKMFGRANADRCVARRALTITQSGEVLRTLEFFTRPPTMFSAESRHELGQLCVRIEQVGWKILY